MKNEDIVTSLIMSPSGPPCSSHPGGDSGGEGTVGVCTATVQTLYSLHKLSPAKCGAIQNWLDTYFMYGRP